MNVPLIPISEHHLLHVRGSSKELVGADFQERPEESTNYKQNIKAISFKLSFQKNTVQLSGSSEQKHDKYFAEIIKFQKWSITFLWLLPGSARHEEQPDQNVLGWTIAKAQKIKSIKSAIVAQTSISSLEEKKNKSEMNCFQGALAWCVQLSQCQQHGRNAVSRACKEPSSSSGFQLPSSTTVTERRAAYRTKSLPCKSFQSILETTT